MPPRSNRDQLLAGAMECLRTKGYARTTARDIAAAADANLASIGYHFGSKDALLNEAVIRNSQEWAEKLGAAAFTESGEAAERPLARMAAGWTAALESFEPERPNLVSFVEAVGQAQWSEELRQRMGEHIRAVREGIAVLVSSVLGEDAEAEGADPRVVAAFLMSVADGLMLQWLVDPEGTPSADELVPALAAALRLAE